MSSSVCLIIRKKTVTNIDRKKQKRYTHLKKRERERVIDTVTYKRQKKSNYGL